MAANTGSHLIVGHKLTSDSIVKLSVSGSSIRNNLKTLQDCIKYCILHSKAARHNERQSMA